MLWSLVEFGKETFWLLILNPRRLNARSPDNPQTRRICISCGRCFTKTVTERERERLRIPRTHSDTGIHHKEREPQRRISRRLGRVLTWRIRRWRRSSRRLLVKEIAFIVIILNREFNYTCRKKSHSLFHWNTLMSFGQLIPIGS